MLTPEQIAEGWIEHDGGPCPVPFSSRVAAIKFRDGLIRTSGGRGFRASAIPWQHILIGRGNPDLHIIAYRPEPRHD